MKSKAQGNAFSTILLATVVAAILDLTAACVTSYLKSGLSPFKVLQYIASAVYGTASFNRGWGSAMVGLIMHFSISFSVALIYFLLYPTIGTLQKKPILSGAILGLGVWLFLNLVVLPNSKVHQPPFETPSVLLGIVLHMLLVGLPIALITKKYFKKKELFFRP